VSVYKFQAKCIQHVPSVNLKQTVSLFLGDSLFNQAETRLNQSVQVKSVSQIMPTVLSKTIRQQLNGI